VSDLVRVEPVALLPTPAGCAVFLGDGRKVIVFYIDPAIGASINAVLSGTQSPRPLSHDLFAQTLDAFGADCIALAVRHKAPLFVIPEVWEELDDMTEALEALRNQEDPPAGFGV